MQNEHLFAHALNCIQEIGPQRLSTLYNRFGSFESAWQASESEFCLALDNTPPVQTAAKNRSHINPRQAFELLQKTGITILLKNDTSYPTPLHHIPDPPVLLYMEGALPAFDKPTLAVVGTRSPTLYGREVCRTLVRPIAQAHIPIISGLALGIDTEAHITTLASEGTTIAILGSGLARSILYPAANRRLADEIIAKGGALLSEYPLYMKASQWTFPLRNRIIAGLATAVLVVEAREKSGTRITTRFAAEYSREVLAVPGSIFSANSWTPHTLIKEGALPVTSADDIFEALGMQSYLPKEDQKNISEKDHMILAQIQEPLSANELARNMSLDIGTVQRTLALLEIRGMVRNIGNGIYRKI